MSGLPGPSVIHEEFAAWRNTITSNYDLMISSTLEYPSATVQWLPGIVAVPGEDYAVMNLILGTTDPDVNELHSLIIAEIQLPLEDIELDQDGYRSDIIFSSKVRILRRINHDGEINRARYMPQNPSIIATKTISGEVHVFDVAKHPSTSRLEGASCPELRLRGHIQEGYGLSWNPLKAGHLLSSADDGKICLWDVNATPVDKVIDTKESFKINEAAVEDVAWHHTHGDLFGSVGETSLHIWDARNSQATNPVRSVVAHQAVVSCLAFNPFSEWTLVTGSDDKTVKIFDLRRLSTTLHTFNFHKDDVFQVGWSPKHEHILASCSRDRRLIVWDQTRIGEAQTSQAAAEGPPELLFIHAGHTATISDFSWNPTDDWVIASVAEDNLLHIWQMADHIYHR